MLKAYKYEIFPTEQQKELLNKHFGCSRFVFNWGLEQKIKFYTINKKTLSFFDLSSKLPELKQTHEWLSTVNAQSLQMALRNLDNAFTAFFHKQNKFPKFKSKHKSKNSFQCPQGIKVDFKKKTINIPKIKNIKTAFDRGFVGKIKTTTLSKTPTGRYFVSILVEDGKALPIKPRIEDKTTIGIDLGLKDFCVTSDGKKFENHKYLKRSEKRLKHHQRKLSKKKKGGLGYRKQRVVLAKIHEKVANQRKDFLHKITYELTHENQVNTICMEDLATKNMMKNHCLAKAIQDVGWGFFTQFLKYKCEWYGKNLIQIGRFEPSSKTCSHCGIIKKDLSLDMREWVCEGCGSEHDRDVNAAINIKNFGLLHPMGLGQRIKKASQRNLGIKPRPTKRRNLLVKK